MPLLQKRRWHAFDSQILRDQAALKFVMDAARQAIDLRGCFRIVLSGGHTPRGLYRALRDIKTDWSAWHIYLADERCLPADNPERNSHLVQTRWLDEVPVPSAQIHLIEAEREPKLAAILYAQLLARVAAFDLVVLGLGTDGHTASLFPHGRLDERMPCAFPVCDAPEPAAYRVTLSAARLSKSRQVIFLVDGEEKRYALKLWREGVAIPASQICPIAGVDIFCSE
ncbi:MAG: 6-phosphogluconolactonase [Gallionella sp.]|jgi:6-phosphogluconolactonase